MNIYNDYQNSLYSYLNNYKKISIIFFFIVVMVGTGLLKHLLLLKSFVILNIEQLMVFLMLSFKNSLRKVLTFQHDKDSLIHNLWNIKRKSQVIIISLKNKIRKNPAQFLSNFQMLLDSQFYSNLKTLSSTQNSLTHQLTIHKLVFSKSLCLTAKRPEKDIKIKTHFLPSMKKTKKNT